ncbi:MAG: hypothetical protein KDJ54_11265 [Candidatus Competibacteraceae bacterium]|nr:hypothetical protein [Candidatus Competibacteraceae bacterium]
MSIPLPRHQGGTCADPANWRQEHILSHTEDDPIVFFFDGKTVQLLESKAAIERFHADTLGG